MIQMMRMYFLSKPPHSRSYSDNTAYLLAGTLAGSFLRAKKTCGDLEPMNSVRIDNDTVCKLMLERIV